MTDIDEKPIKDANDLLRWGMRELCEYGDQSTEEGKARARELVKAQRERVTELLNQSRTFAEEIAAWAGAQQGAQRDEAIQTAAKVFGRMDKVERASYRNRLANLLGIGLREFNDLLKAGSATNGKEGEPVEISEILGGYIEGWLIEYVFDPATGEARLAYRDPERKMGMAEFLDINGIRYVPRRVGSFIKDGGVLFASELGNLRPTRELVGIIEAFIHQHYLLENRYLGKIMAYYVLMTWVYDSFNALPYLRAVGEAGAGKSELMKRIGHLCYRLMMASGANTAASFFRATEMYKGTVFIDEADLHDGGDMSNDIIKWLNAGAMKGNPIWRLDEVTTENGKFYEPACYQTYGPKLIAMRKEFRDDAVASRALTVRLQPREPIELQARNIKLFINDEFRAKALAIRNLLLRWRFEMWEPEIEVLEDHMDLEISSRLNQVTMGMKALAKDDPELQGEIQRFLRMYNQELVLTRSMMLAARVVEAMWRIYKSPSLREKHLEIDSTGNEFIMIGAVTKVADAIIDEMNEAGEEEADEETKKKRKRDKLTPRGVGAIVRNELQLQVGGRRGKGFPVYWDELKLTAMAKRYGVDIETVVVQLEDKADPKQEKIPF